MTQRLPADAGGAVIVSSEVCGYFAFARKPIVAFWRSVGNLPPAVVDALDAMEAAARAAAGRGGECSEFGTPTVPNFDGQGSVAPTLWLSAREAADRLHIGERAVRQALERGRLVGRKQGSERGPWQVSETSVDAYLRSRGRRSA